MDKQIEVWIDGRLTTIIPQSNEDNMREHLMEKFQGRFTIKPHLPKGELEEKSEMIFQKLDINAIKEEATKQAKKLKKNETI
jgi:hypothetical protein